MRVVLTHATLIDCVNPEPIADASVMVQDGRIVEVRPGGETPDTVEAEVIDLQGAYLLPGLWDLHIHPEYLASTGASVAEQTVQFGRRLMECLTESGIIGLRCAGSAHFMDVAWRNAFNSGQVIGPRLFASGYFLTTTGGHFLTSGHARECDGPYGFVQAIRDQMKHDVDHIKLNLSGGIMGPSWDRHWHSFLLEDEIKVAFTICRQREFKVMAHATNPEAVKAAIELGAHTVEHGYIMDDACIELFLKHDTWYVPTLAISHLTPEQAENEWERRYLEQRGLTPDLCCRADAAAEEHRKWFQRALQAGVKMALGSDIRPLKDAALLEMGLWAKNGATPWQTLLAATKHAAEVCGAGDELGTVEVGKLADLIVVADNPLDDIQHLRQLHLVLKEGHIVADKRK
ncbi:MAG: amidohydrolase family protein [Candidatus Tectomicrobia bacterium]|nr:amidohydrolase family protein [Candidatus Tectomicrobia bacterium]